MFKDCRWVVVNLYSHISPPSCQVDRILAVPGLKKSLHNTPHVLINEKEKFPPKGSKRARTQNEDQTVSQVPPQISSQALSQVPPQASSQDSPQIGNYEIQTSTSRAGTFSVSEDAEVVPLTSIYDVQGTTVNASTEEVLGACLNKSSLQSFASDSMTEVGTSNVAGIEKATSGANRTAEIVETNIMKNKRCANIKSSSDMLKTYSTISTNLTSNQEKNPKTEILEIGRNFNEARTSTKVLHISKVAQKKNIVLNDTRNKIIDLTEEHQSRRKADKQIQKVQNIVAKGTCLQNAIDVDEIDDRLPEVIDLTDEIRENPTASTSKRQNGPDSEDHFFVTKSIMRVTPKTGKKLEIKNSLRIKKEVKQERLK